MQKKELDFLIFHMGSIVVSMGQIEYMLRVFEKIISNNINEKLTLKKRVKILMKNIDNRSQIKTFPDGMLENARLLLQKIDKIIKYRNAISHSMICSSMNGPVIIGKEVKIGFRSLHLIEGAACKLSNNLSRIIAEFKTFDFNREKYNG
jgi:hypothetical protein